MNSNKEIAMAFSGGRFFEVEDRIADSVEWNIYEEKMFMTGRRKVLDFCKTVAAYFESVTTKFEMSGLLIDGDRVAIYGRAEFLRGGEVINVVHSCDVYEFDSLGLIRRINSYCNSQTA